MVLQEPSQRQIVRQRERLIPARPDQGEDLCIRGLDMGGNVAKNVSPDGGLNGRNGERDPGFPQACGSGATKVELLRDEIGKEQRDDHRKSVQPANFLKMEDGTGIRDGLRHL